MSTAEAGSDTEDEVSFRSDTEDEDVPHGPTDDGDVDMWSSPASAPPPPAPAVTAASTASASPMPEFLPWRLFTVKPFTAAENVGAASLRQLVGAGRLRPKWVVLCDYMIDPTYLFSAWPELLTCHRVVIFHGCRDIVLGAGRSLPASITLVKMKPNEVFGIPWG